MPTAMPNSMANSMAASMAASMATATDPGTDPIQAATSAPSDSAAAARPAGIATAETIAEHEGALADVSDVHADVCRDSTQVLDRLALVPPALQLVQRRWSAASDRAPAPAQVAEHFRRQTQELKDGVDAAMRFEQRTADVDQLINAPAPAETTPKEAEDYRRLSAQQQEHHNWSRRARDLLRNLRWPAAIPGPTSITQLHAGLAARETFDAHCNAQWQALQAQVETALSELSTAIDAGVYRAANASLGEARRLLRGLPARHSGKLQSQCTTLAARVQEMRDWQDFATHPKREALCASMELLVEEQLDPESRADRIKALRAEWHDLGPLTSASERALFDRFNAAATSAFAPARAYFEEQAKLRAENLVNRQRVCSTLAHYVANNDWSKADWKLAQQVLRLAREEFLSYSPVDRGPGRDVGKRFDTAADALHALIKGEWDKNVATKERIVADAAQLLSATDPLSTRIERVKSLQHEWRNIGATPRGADQKLWKLFRAHCDAVFTAREAERQVHEVAAHSEAETATGVCEALEARGADPTPIENQSELAALRARFDALQLFGDAARRLQRRFKDGEQAYLQRLRDHQHAERRQDFLSILDVNDVLAGFERNPATFDEAALAAALEMAGDTNLDARVATLRANNVAPLAADADVAAERLRWTIYAEILAGLDSPGEDQSLRLELQVNRLAEGLGRRGTERLDLPAVLAAWVSAGADTGDARTVTWRARLEKAIDAYLG